MQAQRRAAPGGLTTFGEARRCSNGPLTTSAVEGNDQTNQRFANTTNHGDATFASECGGGILLRVTRCFPLLLDIGARYLKNGQVTYLTKEA